MLLNLLILDILLTPIADWTSVPLFGNDIQDEEL